MILLELFLTFLFIGFVSFGGGYAMIPLIQKEVVERHHWMKLSEFTDTIAAAGMAPGPIANNAAIFVGYAEAGWIGAMVATLGMLLPSLLIVSILAIMIKRVERNALMKGAFYGLRPVITGMIFYAAWLFANRSGLGSIGNIHTVFFILVYIGSLYLLIRVKLHPLYVILLSGLIGAAVWG